MSVRPVVDVSDVFWDAVYEINDKGEDDDEGGPVVRDERLASIERHVSRGFTPMLTGEAIRLPRLYFDMWTHADDDGTKCEFEFDTVLDLFEGVYEMYEDSASWVQESLSQRIRRRKMRGAVDYLRVRYGLENVPRRI